MTRYTRLTLAEREEISRQLATGAGVRAMARHLGRAPSPISPALSRTGRLRWRYRRHPSRALSAHRLAVRRGPRRRRPRTLTTHALRRDLVRALRKRHTRRRAHRPGRAHDRRGQLPDRSRLEERPVEVADRTIPGHGAGDRLLGRRLAAALGTLAERTTRPTLRGPLQAKDAPSVRRAFAREMRTRPQPRRRSLPYDRGTERAEPRLFTETTGIPGYWAHPQRSWERGTNENMTGRLRPCFPQRTDGTPLAR